MVRVIEYTSYLPYNPLGFPKFSGRANKDQLRRKILKENETNLRIYKFVHQQLGINGRTELEKKVKTISHSR